MPTQQELKQQGNVHFQNDDFEKAIEFYTLAIEKDALCDEAAPILSNRSLCYYNLKKYKEAYEDAGCCCGIRPDWAKGFARRGSAAEKLGEFDIALESYDEYLKLDKSDEMDINSKRNSVKKIVEANEATERKRERDLAATEKKLVEGRVLAQDVLYEGCQKKDIQRIELAVKHGADLSHNRLSVSSDSSITEFNMTPARLALQYLHVDEETKSLDEFRRTALLVKQRKYLDRLLDLCREQQQTPYEPDCRMVEELIPLLFSCETFPLRKDIFLLLLEKGKTFFLGENASEKEFRIAVVNRMMFARERNQDQRGTQFQPPLTDSFDGDQLRDFRECIELALKGLSNEDIKSVHTVRSSSLLYAAIEETFLENAVKRTQVAEIAECFLKRGADPGQLAAAHKEYSLLDVCLVAQFSSCSRILIGYGAKVTTRQVDGFMSFTDETFLSSISLAHVLSNSLVPPQKYTYAHLESVMDGFIGQREAVCEEPLRFFFDTLADQNLGLSFLVKGNEGVVNVLTTPFLHALKRRASIKLLKLILRIRPRLAHTPAFCHGAGATLVSHPFGFFFIDFIRYVNNRGEFDFEWESKPSSFEYVTACLEALLQIYNDINFDTTPVHWVKDYDCEEQRRYSVISLLDYQKFPSAFGMKFRAFCKQRLKKEMRERVI